jgi:Zn-dependent M28 family amino/carboxypeptidase
VTHSRTRAATFTAAITAIATAGITVGATTASAEQTDSQKIRREVSASKIFDHLDAFQRIADRNGGTRASGTAGYEASASYVERTLRDAGYTTERQYFPFTYTEILGETVRENSPTPRDIDNHVMTASPSTPEGGVTAELVRPANLGCDAADWSGVVATGKIALVQRGTCAFAQKSQRARTAGAAAVIIYNNADGELNGTLGDNPQGVAPTTGITQADGQALVADMARGPVSMTVDLRTLVEQRETFNVIAETRRGSSDDVVMLGSHLDSVVGGAGINDNASGSSTILAVAEAINSPKYALQGKVRFAWWGAEETGLVGSTHYVAGLPQSERDAITTYLNFDMLGSPNFQIGVYDADNSSKANAADAKISPGSVETADFFQGYFDGIGQPWTDTPVSGRSDYKPFADNGIAFGGVFSGGDGIKTAQQQQMFGGTAGVAYDPNYHTERDDISNVNRTSIDIMSDAVAHAALTLAQDPTLIP